MNFSKLDSDRFQCNIYRDNYESLPTDLLQQLIQNKADIGILRLNTKEQASLHQLNDAGIPYIVADTLVEYIAKPSGAKEIKFLNSDIEIIEASSEEDWKNVDLMVEKCFGNYSNHYYSNPFLSKIGNVAGYKEWSRSCSGANGVTYIVKTKSTAAGFFSIAFKGDLADGGPGGIIPEFEGSGLYLDFHKMLPQLIFKKGLKKLKTSTQVQNNLVQRQWNMSGWMLSHSWLTLHVNTFFNKAYNGSATKKEFSHKNSFDFIDSELSIANFSNISFRQLLPMQAGKSYTIFVSDSIENLANHNNMRSVIIEDEQHRAAAVAWLR